MLSIIVPIAVIVIVVLIIATGYVKAPPDKAYIISGTGKRKILIGRAGVRIPGFTRIDNLLLRQVSVDIKTNGYIPTKDFIGVDIDAIAKVAVMSDGEVVEILDKRGDQVYPDGHPHAGEHYRIVNGIDLAMKNFLNMNEEQIVHALTDSLQGNMREIIGIMTLRDISSDRKAFGDQVQEKAQADMNNLGIKIISCNIQKVVDENGLINALGQDNMSQIQKEAAIAKAEADRDVAIRQAQTEQEANDAKVTSELAIAQRNNELALRESELKQTADKAKADADAAYVIQKAIQQKQVNTENVNAEIAQAEREADLKERQVSIKERELDADVRKQADADRYAIEQKAEADRIQKQKAADAAKYVAEQEAQGIRAKYEAEYEAEAAGIAAKGKAEAEAAKAKGLAEYETEAAGIAARGKAEAEAAQAKGLAEAAGIAARGKAEAEAAKAKGLAEAEAMEKKADAYKKYNDAAIAEMIINILPDMARAIAEPVGSIKDLRIYGSGNGSDGSGIEQVSGMTPTVMKQVFDTMSDATGVDMREILKANTYDAKVNRKVELSGAVDTHGFEDNHSDNAEKAADIE